MFAKTFRDPAFVAAAAYVEPTDGTAFDSFEEYADAADLNGLNLGTVWSAAYVSHNYAQPVTDDFESYTNGADLGSLNGGINWDGAYVSH